MNFVRTIIAGLCVVCVLSIYVWTNRQLAPRTPISANPEFSVRLPIPAQLLLALGDRYLAANLNGFTVLIADTSRMKPEDYAIQAGLQQDISWFNPFHEDNYYIAASILSWGGQVPATQTILQRAGNARTFDYLPLFHYGFNLYHFYNDPVRGAEALLAATPRASAVQDQWALQNIAAQWIERGYRLDEAAYRVEAMAKSAPPGNFRRYLAVRAARLRMLEELRKHALRYQHISGRKLESIDELVAAGIVAALPQDPLKVGFAVGSDGMPIFKNALRKNQP